MEGDNRLEQLKAQLDSKKKDLEELEDALIELSIKKKRTEDDKIALQGLQEESEAVQSDIRSLESILVRRSQRNSIVFQRGQDVGDERSQVGQNWTSAAQSMAGFDDNASVISESVSTITQAYVNWKIPPDMPKLDDKAKKDPENFWYKFISKLELSNCPFGKYIHVLLDCCQLNQDRDTIRRIKERIDKLKLDSQSLPNALKKEFLLVYQSPLELFYRQLEFFKTRRKSNESHAEGSRRFRSMMDKMFGSELSMMDIAMLYYLVFMNDENLASLGSKVIVDAKVNGVELTMDQLERYVLFAASTRGVFREQVEDGNYKTKPDKQKSSHEKNAGTDSKSDDSKKKVIKCFACNSTEHKLPECNDPRKDLKCDICRKVGHLKKDCPKKPKDSGTVGGVHVLKLIDVLPEEQVMEPINTHQVNNLAEPLLQRTPPTPLLYVHTNCYQDHESVATKKQLLKTLIDGGAQKTCIQRRVAITKDWKVQPLNADQPSMTGAVSHNGTAADSIARIYIHIGDHLIQHVVEVLDLQCDADVVIGRDLYSTLNIIEHNIPFKLPGQSPTQEPDVVEEEDWEDELSTSERYVQFRERAYKVWKPFIEANQAIPPGTVCPLPESVYCLDLIDESKVNYVPQYPLPEQYKEKVREVVRDGLKIGVFRVAKDKPGRIANNPLTVVPKKDAMGFKTKLRVCIDLRTLNRNTKDDPRPTANSKEVILGCAGAEIHTLVDLETAYNSLAISEEYRWYFAFTLDGVRYECCMCPFGGKGVPGHFQFLMNSLVGDIKGCRSYQDDTCISTSFDAHIECVKQFLIRMNNAKLRINISKSKFCQASILLLGHIITPTGTRMDPAKLQALHDYPKPENGKALQRFLGLANWFRDYVKNYSSISGPLDAKRNVKGRLIWTPVMETAFENIKKALNVNATLTFPNWDKKFHLYVDASLTGLGAYLSQEDDKGQMKIVTCISRALKEEETRYSATKRELLAIVWALEKFHGYLVGRKFLLFTDHKALVFLCAESRQLPAQMSNWVDRLLIYDFDIAHVDGVSNQVADAFSRQYENWLHKGNGKAILSLYENGGSINTISSADLALLQEEKGKVIPETVEEREGLMRKTHLLGHFGTEAMFRSLYHDKNVWWPSMRHDLTMLVKNCHPCMRFNVQKMGYHPLKTITADGPWDKIQMDVKTGMEKDEEGYSAVLVVMCVFTRFLLAIPLKNMGMQETAQQLWSLFNKFGLPKVVISDQGSNFVNEVLTAMKKQFGYRHETVDAYNHQANGGPERGIRTVFTTLAKQLSGAGVKWRNWLGFAQLAYNTKVSRVHGSTPFSLMFGRSFNGFEDFSHTMEGSFDLQAVQEKWSQIEKIIYPTIAEVTAQSRKKAREYAMKTRKAAQELTDGTTVFAKNETRASKWDSPFEGPFVTVGKDVHGSYLLKDGTGAILKRHFPIHFLKVGVTQDNGSWGYTKDVFDVKSIKAHRSGNNGFEYLIEWKQNVAWVDDWSDSWVTESDIFDKQCIRDYWKRISAGGELLQNPPNQGAKV